MIGKEEKRKEPSRKEGEQTTKCRTRPGELGRGGGGVMKYGAPGCHFTRLVGQDQACAEACKTYFFGIFFFFFLNTCILNFLQF